jgi:NitT/TauT family transport system ATP-binding protein
MSAVIEAVDVNHFYEGQLGWNHALDHLSLTIRHNEFLCILGPSGCGKSTFLKIVAGLIRPSTGSVLLNDRPIRGPGLDRGVVFQDPALFAWLTVLRNVEFGLLMGGWKRHAARDRPRQADLTVSVPAVRRHEASRRGGARVGADRRGAAADG